jgi:hypothetical protein
MTIKFTNKSFMQNLYIVLSFTSILVVESLSKPKPDVDIGKVEGWVEVIVRDKHGRIKYAVGLSPEELRKLKEKEGNGDCDCTPPVISSLPSKDIDIHYWRKNVVTNVGLAAIIRLIGSGLTENKFGYIAIGTGTTPEAITDTALQTEIKRKSATVSQVTTTITGDTALFEATFSSADTLSGSHNVSEAGVFNASSGGILLARKVFSAVPVNWDAGDQLTIPPQPIIG